MISAMPAVAVRRERKKTRSFRGNGPPSRHSSVTSLARAKGRGASVSTICSQTGHPFFKDNDTVCGLTRDHLRLFIYLGTVLLVTGLVLVFIGVGAEVNSTHSVGLVFIGIGAFLCLVKVFLSESRNLRKKGPVLPKASPLDGGYVVVPTSAPPATRPEHDPKTIVSPTSINPSVTPTSLNSIPETQVLITDEHNRF